MGAAKPLLELRGRTFLDLAVAALRDGGCRDVVCVVPAGEPEIAEAAVGAGARTVTNADAGPEQIDSLRRALDDVAPDTGAVIVLPVDHPLVRAGTVRSVIAAWRRATSPVARAVRDGRPGHPTLFDRRVFAELRADQPLGARSVVERHARLGEVVDVDVDDAGVEADLDTPADVERWEGGP